MADSDAVGSFSFSPSGFLEAVRNLAVDIKLSEKRISVEEQKSDAVHTTDGAYAGREILILEPGGEGENVVQLRVGGKASSAVNATLSDLVTNGLLILPIKWKQVFDSASPRVSDLRSMAENRYLPLVELALLELHEHLRVYREGVSESLRAGEDVDPLLNLTSRSSRWFQSLAFSDFKRFVDAIRSKLAKVPLEEWWSMLAREFASHVVEHWKSTSCSLTIKVDLENLTPYVNSFHADSRLEMRKKQSLSDALKNDRATSMIVQEAFNRGDLIFRPSGNTLRCAVEVQVSEDALALRQGPWMGVRARNDDVTTVIIELSNVIPRNDGRCDFSISATVRSVLVPGIVIVFACSGRFSGRGSNYAISGVWTSVVRSTWCPDETVYGMTVHNKTDPMWVKGQEISVMSDSEKGRDPLLGVNLSSILERDVLYAIRNVYVAGDFVGASAKAVLSRYGKKSSSPLQVAHLLGELLMSELSLLVDSPSKLVFLMTFVPYEATACWLLVMFEELTKLKMLQYTAPPRSSCRGKSSPYLESELRAFNPRFTLPVEDVLNRLSLRKTTADQKATPLRASSRPFGHNRTSSATASIEGALRLRLSGPDVQIALELLERDGVENLSLWTRGLKVPIDSLERRNRVVHILAFKCGVTEEKVLQMLSVICKPLNATSAGPIVRFGRGYTELRTVDGLLYYLQSVMFGSENIVRMAGRLGFQKVRRSHASIKRLMSPMVVRDDGSARLNIVGGLIIYMALRGYAAVHQGDGLLRGRDKRSAKRPKPSSRPYTLYSVLIAFLAKGSKCGAIQRLPYTERSGDGRVSLTYAGKLRLKVTNAMSGGVYVLGKALPPRECSRLGQLSSLINGRFYNWESTASSAVAELEEAAKAGRHHLCGAVMYKNCALVCGTRYDPISQSCSTIVMLVDGQHSRMFSTKKMASFDPDGLLIPGGMSTPECGVYSFPTYPFLFTERDMI